MDALAARSLCLLSDVEQLEGLDPAMRQYHIANAPPNVYAMLGITTSRQAEGTLALLGTPSSDGDLRSALRTRRREAPTVEEPLPLRSPFAREDDACWGRVRRQDAAAITWS